MCGITGIFDTRGKREIDRAVLHRMNESQRHRGPVEGGVHVEAGLGLGHRRLSIIDLATGLPDPNQTFLLGIESLRHALAFERELSAPSTAR